MAGFVAALGAAIPVIQDIVNEVKQNIDKKTQDPTQTQETTAKASAAATDATKDSKKGPAAAQAVTPIVTTAVATAAKAGADEVAASASASFSKAQLDLSNQLVIVAGLKPFFDAEDIVFAMKAVITFKGQKLDSDDIAMLKSLFKTATNNLEDISKQGADLLKLEDPERSQLLRVDAARGLGVLQGIDDALGSLGGGNPLFSELTSNIDDLFGRLSDATFAALLIIQDLSDGLKNAAAATSTNKT
jgi:hypothetical protein